MTSVIETALSPFRYFDMATIYNAHTQIIDGVIFFSIFLGLIYLSVASIMPNLFDYIASRAPFINGLLGIVFLISLLKTIQSLFAFIFKRHSKNQIDDFALDKKNTQKEIDLEDKEIRTIKHIRNRLTTVNEIMDRLTVIENTVKKNPVLSPEQSNIIKISLSEIANKENIVRKNYNDMYLRFRELGKIDSERLQRLEDELKTASKNSRKFKETEIDIEKRKLEYDRTILDLKTKLDSLIIRFNNQINASIQQLHNYPESSLSGISDAKKTLKEIKGIAVNIKQLERELIHLHKSQKELYRGERRKRR